MVEKLRQKILAAVMVLLGLVQAGAFIMQDELIFALLGVAYALGGLAFLIDI